MRNITRVTSRAVNVAVGLLAISATAHAQTSDTEPPELIEFSFTPNAVDVTGGAQSVNVNARVTDDLSGVSFIELRFVSPSQAQFRSFGVPRTGGGPLDGTYAATIEIPQYVEPGVWTAEIRLVDAVSNNVFLTASNLSALGFPTELQVLSNPDEAAPQLISAVFSPAAIDVSGSDQIVTVDLHLTDDVSGVALETTLFATLQSPSGFQSHILRSQALSLISGDELDGTWRGEITIPQHSEAGTWVLDIDLSDGAGNRLLSRVSAFDVASATPDQTAPVVTGFSFAPAVIDTSAGAATVTVTLDVTDDLAGAHFALDTIWGGWTHGVFFTSPSTAQLRIACCNGISLVSGDALNGSWQGTVQFPQFSEAGTWKASFVQISDRVHNFLNLSAPEIEALSLPADLIIVRPSLVGDAVIGPAGGTVMDETFQERAQVVFPPGLVDEDTQVAIDVFPDPLAIPSPVGFQGPGTYFVNVDLEPEPDFPFPPPGLTVVLPLPDFINPGTPIQLFFVDPATGDLAPMTSVGGGAGGGPGGGPGGGAVVGFVNADGLTATFNGISHLSILVGLVPDVIPVGIDIKPFGPNNLIVAGSRSRVRVALLSSEGFHAPQVVDRRSLTFGKTGDEDSLEFCEWFGKDVNRDGLRDLICHFAVDRTGLEKGDETGVLKGQTWDQEPLIGADAVKVFEFVRPPRWPFRHSPQDRGPK